MRSATKRILIAGAGLTAAALFGSLPYHGSSQAEGLPSQHHDVGVTSQAVTLADYTSLPEAPTPPPISVPLSDASSLLGGAL
jgi:hypothetical protein